MSIGRVSRVAVALMFVAFTSIAMVPACVLPAAGAAALLHPVRPPGHPRTPIGCSDTTFAADGIALRGWRCKADGQRRGTLIYLHGVADTCAGGAGIAAHFMMRGFDRWIDETVPGTSRGQGGSAHDGTDRDE